MADQALEGAQAGATMLDAGRKNAAYNALRQVYGDGAVDADAAKTLQATTMAQKQAQRDGQVRAAMALSDTINNGGDVGAAYDQLVAPNADSWGIDPAHVKPTRDLLTNPATNKQTISHIIQSLQYGSPSSQVTGGPIYTQNTDGSYGVAFKTKGGGIVAPNLNGATPTAPAQGAARVATGQKNADTNVFRAQTNADLGAKRVGIAQQNANTNAASAGIRSNNSVFGASPEQPIPVTATPVPAAPAAPVAAPAAAPADDLSAGSLTPARLDNYIAAHGGKIDDAVAAAPNGAIANALIARYNQNQGKGAPVKPGTPAPAAAAAPVAPAAAAPAPATTGHPMLFDSLPPKGRQLAIGQATNIQNQHTNLQNTNSILDTLDKQVDGWTTGAPGVLLAHLPGSQANNIKRNLETIKAQGLMSWIASLKNAQGQTGIGRVLQSEANTATALYGNMEQDQDAPQLKYHLKLFRRSVNSLLDHAETAFHTFYGKGTADVMSGGQSSNAKPPAGLKLPPGFTYVGPAD